MKPLKLLRISSVFIGLGLLTSCDFGGSSGGGSSAPTPQTILVMGDSISEGGFYGEIPWPALLNGMVAEWTVVISGWGTDAAGSQPDARYPCFRESKFRSDLLRIQ